MTQNVTSFYKKKLISKGLDKANQVVKRQKALAAVELATAKQATNKNGRHQLRSMFHCSSDSVSSFSGFVLVFSSVWWRCTGTTLYFDFFWLFNLNTVLPLLCLLIYDLAAGPE